MSDNTNGTEYMEQICTQFRSQLYSDTQTWKLYFAVGAQIKSDKKEFG
jgi:hypothetical protein